MRNAEAVEVVARHRGDAVVVITMTTIFTFPDAADDELTIRCAPLMGGASSIGLGVALARPERPVIVVDGDGSLIMQLGALTTIAEAAPPNLYHFVCNNRVLYEGGGRLPVANAAGVDFVGLARAAGYPATFAFGASAELDEAFPRVLATPGPVLVDLAIDLPNSPRWSNENPQAELPDWWFTMMGDDARAAAAALAKAAG